MKRLFRFTKVLQILVLAAISITWAITKDSESAYATLIWLVAFSIASFKSRKAVATSNGENRKEPTANDKLTTCMIVAITLFSIGLLLDTLAGDMYAFEGDLPFWAVMLDGVYYILWALLCLETLAYKAIPSNKVLNAVHLPSVVILMIVITLTSIENQNIGSKAQKEDMFKVALDRIKKGDSVPILQGYAAMLFVIQNEDLSLQIAVNQKGLNCIELNSMIKEITDAAINEYNKNPNYQYFEDLRASMVIGNLDGIAAFFRVLKYSGYEFFDCSNASMYKNGMIYL